MKISIKAAAITFWVIWAGLIFWSTLMAMVGVGSTPFQFFDQLYLNWLSPSFGGLFFNTFLGSIDGLIGGAILAMLYNALTPEMDE